MWLRLLVYISVLFYLVELTLGAANSLEGNPFFLWTERMIATVFTCEYVVRLKRGGRQYARSGLGIVDAIAVIPFWAGFFVPAAWLGPVRAMRILRLLKLFRYNPSLQLVARGFKRAWPMCRALSIATLIFWLFSSVVIFELEKTAQPDDFTLYQSFWFTAVTMTTVGYGDMSPQTPPGQAFSMGMFIVALALYSGVLGTIATALSEEVKDTNERSTSECGTSERSQTPSECGSA
jgi:voltage-gated potassium channel